MSSDDPLIRRCAERIREVYGPRLAGIVLYGSVARGEEGPESDVDLLVLIKGEYKVFDEIECLVDALYDLELESGRLICALPARAEEYRRGTIQLYRNATREGVPL
jgi:predicted nucleotidyltransferase